MDNRNPYADPAEVVRRIEKDGHRFVIGDMWDEMGRLQFEFTKSRGLRPDHKMLDLGCGALRGGVEFVAYLDPGNYYGLDINQSLLDAGYDIELAKLGLQDRMPRGNLICRDDFDAASLGVSFDIVIAQSVFTHVPLEDVARALRATAPVVKPGGVFYATFFEAPETEELAAEVPRSGRRPTYRDKNPFHQRPSDLERAADPAFWRFEYIGEWGHPREQKMAMFERRA